MVNNLGLKKVYVTRFQGGSNAGHTSEKDGVKVKQHQIPSIAFVPEDVKVVGIMADGMNLNPDDLRIEHDYIETMVGEGSLKGRLVVSQNAILNTDLDRAEETILDLQEGKTSGSTSEGMRTSSAHYYDRTGPRYEDLMADDWKERLGKKYDQLADRFEKSFGRTLADELVPDYETVAQNDIKDAREPGPKGDKGEVERPKRKVGTKEEFLDRLAQARDWLIQKDMVHDTVQISRESLYETLNNQAGIIHEGAQALGLHPWLGTVGSRDVTSTNTDPIGALYATKTFRVDDMQYKIGVMKATYMSSVGRRRMKTMVPLDKKTRKLSELPSNATDDQKWAGWIRETAREFGTTTGRPRDICHLDLPFLAYNCFASGINMLAVTHVDIARKGEKIKVCTHYAKNGIPVAYYPGIEAVKDVEAKYIEIDGWDMEEVQRAKSYEELPEGAKRLLAFIQARTGVPVVFSTTGPDRENYLPIPEQRTSKQTFSEVVYDRLAPRKQIFPN
jgi:adenylosuccinate synthase